MSAGEQAWIFLYSVAGGAVIALLYDFFRIKRKAIKTRTFFIHIEDLAYWVTAAIVMFAVVSISNDGEIRGFTFIGMILGAVLYVFLFSKLVMSVSMMVINFFKKVLRAIWTVATYPFVVIFKILWIPCRYIYRAAKAIFKKLRQFYRNKLLKGYMWRRAFKNARKKT